MTNKNEINVKLNDELFYDYQGDKKKAEFITLKKPTTKNISLTSVIKSTFQNAALELSNKQKTVDSPKEVSSKDDSEFSLQPEEALQLLFSASNGIEKAVLSFKELLREVALIDGEIKATVPLIDQLSVDDFENIFGKYLVNFILASLLGMTSKV